MSIAKSVNQAIKAVGNIVGEEIIYTRRLQNDDSYDVTTGKRTENTADTYTFDATPTQMTKQDIVDGASSDHLILIIPNFGDFVPNRQDEITFRDQIFKIVNFKTYRIHGEDCGFRLFLAA